VTIIQQIGLPFEEINSIENSNLKDFPVIIVSSGSLTKKEREALYNYTVEGGVVISEAENAKALY
jgi:hypothetical protein